MDYKYLAKNHISEQQTIIVRDYFETPLETHGNHLDHITHICQYYNISAPLLRIMVSHFKIYDTQTHCRECNIMRQIYEPTYNYQNQKFNWICDDCPHCQNSCHPHSNNLNGGKGDNHGTIQSRTQTSNTRQTFIT